MCSSLRLVTMISFCIFAAIAAPSHIDADEPVNTDTRHNVQQELDDDVVFVQRRTPQYNTKPKSRESKEPCTSNRTNNVIPTANIVGHQNLWNRRDPMDDAFLKTHWLCTGDSAFVHGGMRFEQVDKKLYVPECGYYYVASQVYFQPSSSEITSMYAQHQLSVQPNCGEADVINANAYAPANATVTTFTGRLFKICAGGSITVKIPTGSDRACCAYGKRHSTFFSAHLVQPLSDCNN